MHTAALAAVGRGPRRACGVSALKALRRAYDLQSSSRPRPDIRVGMALQPGPAAPPLAAVVF